VFGVIADLPRELVASRLDTSGNRPASHLDQRRDADATAEVPRDLGTAPSWQSPAVSGPRGTPVPTEIDCFSHVGEPRADVAPRSPRPGRARLLRAVFREGSSVSAHQPW